MLYLPSSLEYHKHEQSLFTVKFLLYLLQVENLAQSKYFGLQFP